MSETVIKVEGLSKQYKIAHEKKDTYKTFSQTITENTKNLLAPWKFFQTQDLEIFKAIDNVNFEIKKGDKVAIIGRNGAGKSTMLKVLSRITEPTEGTVKIKGRVASLLEVGTGFHPELTGRENIFLNGAILGMSKKEIREKFDDIVEFSGCEKFLDTPVKRYSSGMRVRLGFAVAAHLESEILIVDEVLAVGDAEFQKKCLGKMDEISKGEGRTIIFVSHNMSAVQNLCEKAIILDKGKAKFIGEVNDCIQFYRKTMNDSTKVSYNLLDSGYGVKLIPVESKHHFNPDEDITFKLKIDSPEEIGLVSLDFAVIDEDDRRCITFMNDYIDHKVDIKKGINDIEVVIKTPNLSPGDFFLKVHIYNMSKKDVILLFDSYKIFSVNNVNYYGSSDSFMNNHGVITPIIEIY